MPTYLESFKAGICTWRVSQAKKAPKSCKGAKKEVTTVTTRRRRVTCTFLFVVIVALFALYNFSRSLWSKTYPLATKENITHHSFAPLTSLALLDDRNNFPESAKKSFYQKGGRAKEKEGRGFAGLKKILRRIFRKKGKKLLWKDESFDPVSRLDDISNPKPLKETPKLTIRRPL